MTQQTQEKQLNLWRITQGQRGRYSLAIISMACTNLFMFGAPLVGGWAIDVVTQRDFSYGNAWLVGGAQELTGAAEPYLTYLWLSAGFALLITVLGGAFLYLRGRLAAVASEDIVCRLRGSLYDRLHHLRAHFYDDADTGDLVQRCSSDVETLRVFLSSDVIEIGRAIMLLACVTPVFFMLDTRLAWLSLCLMPFLAIGAYIFFSRVKDVFLVTDEAEGAMTATLQENLTGIRVVRAFARQEFEVAKFAERNAEFRNNNYRLIRLMGFYWGTSDLFAMSQIAIVLFAGASFIMNDTLTVGVLFTFLTMEGMVIWPVRQLGRVLTDTGKAVVALGRVNEILLEPAEAEGVVPNVGRTGGAIAIENLHFAYEEDRPVLEGVSLNIEPGETIAIVGAPGTGKSSLIRVLLRMYPYSQGSVRIDGHEVADVNRQWLRSQIAVVLQEPFLYSRSVRANLAVGRPNAPEEDVLAACDDAAILESIQEFPEQFEAMVGERGVTLSGGQRQRLALARALLKDPPVLILDDSLSAVDTGTEGHILRALQRRKGRQTTLIIAHRLSSVIAADRIVVLENGGIAQLGNHATLSTQPGPYRRLCEIQGALDSSIRTDVEATRLDDGGRPDDGRLNDGGAESDQHHG